MSTLVWVIEWEYPRKCDNKQQLLTVKQTPHGSRTITILLLWREKSIGKLFQEFEENETMRKEKVGQKQPGMLKRSFR